ncbi:putative Prion-inhibition and propagation HeLo domain-containing protein [Seiridium cardinale]
MATQKLGDLITDSSQDTKLQHPWSGILPPRLGIQYTSSSLKAFGDIFKYWYWGFTPGSQQDSHRSREEEDNKFLQLLRRFGEGERVTFIVIDVGTAKSGSGKIIELGLSAWSYSESIMSRHWRVGQRRTAEQEAGFGNSDSFEFGETQFIESEDITQILNEWFLRYRTQDQQSCLVVFGGRTLRHIQAQWTIPADVTILDMELVWQSRFQRFPGSLSEALTSINNVDYWPILLENLGNRVHFLACLLSDLAMKELKNTEIVQKSEIGIMSRAFTVGDQWIG